MSGRSKAPISSSPAWRPRASSTCSACPERRPSTSTSRCRARPSDSFRRGTSRRPRTWPTPTAASPAGPASVSRPGPGATNLVTGVADAFLDRAPIVVLTGQGDLERMHKESHQYIDVLAIMRPITKWNARVGDPAIIPEVVRKAFKVAEAEKPGSTHIELPEDVMAADTPRASRSPGRSRSTPMPRPPTSPVPRSSSAGPRTRSRSRGTGRSAGERPAPFARSRAEPASRSRRRSWPRG